MKYLILPLLLLTFASYGQSLDGTVKLKDLAVPNSPGFILTDIAPTLTQSSNTPKQFVLGVAQVFQSSGNSFPQNYSTEFTPYWWLSTKSRNVYSFAGLKTVNGQVKENIFSGLKFTSVSVSFLNKDLIPDSADAAQKIFAIGAKTTIIKIHAKSYSASLNKKMDAWHAAALDELSVAQDAIANEPDSAKRRLLIRQFANMKPQTTGDLAQQINDQINEKPIFSWDIAAAYATYGIGDTSWQTGRAGAWTTLATYVPLGKNTKNYLDINIAARYQLDNYYLNSKGTLEKANSVDIGGRLGLEFERLSIGAEALYRYYNGVSGSANRTVGYLNYRVSDNLYINGAFGKSFESTNKLIALFGINWGFGKEEITLPAN
jgi:hypothetical protein